MLILGLRYFLKHLNNQIQIPHVYRKAEHDGKAIQNQILTHSYDVFKSSYGYISNH